jgi:hypothetical protein
VVTVIELWRRIRCTVAGWTPIVNSRVAHECRRSCTCLPRPWRSRFCRHRIASCQSERPRWLRALQVPPVGSSGADFRHLGDLAFGWVAHPQGAGACPPRPHRRCRKTNGVGRLRRLQPTALVGACRDCSNGSACHHRLRLKCSPPKGVSPALTNRRDARLTERPRPIFPAPRSPRSGPGLL